MTALGIEQHCIDQERIAFPLEPFATRTACQIGRLPALDHHTLDHRQRRFGAMDGEIIPACEIHQRRQIETARVELFDQFFKPLTAVLERQCAHVLPAIEQDIVDPKKRGMLLQHLGSQPLAVETLLQVRERADLDAGRIGQRARDQQLAVHRAFERQRIHKVGKRTGDIVAGARIKPFDALIDRRLNPDTVPFPFAGEVSRIELGEIGILDRV